MIHVNTVKLHGGRDNTSTSSEFFECKICRCYRQFDDEDVPVNTLPAAQPDYLKPDSSTSSVSPMRYLICGLSSMKTHSGPVAHYKVVSLNPCLGHWVGVCSFCMMLQKLEAS